MTTEPATRSGPCIRAVGGGRIEAPKLFEDFRLLPGRDARSGIPHFDAQIVLPTSAPDQHPALGGVTHSVGQEILEHATQQACVRMDDSMAARETQRQSAVSRKHLEFGGK